MRIAVLHNLLAGGAHRRLREQLSRLDADVVEVCLQTAIPIRADATVVPLAPRAPRVPRPLRVPLRYVDFLTLLTAWRRAATLVRALDVRVVYANPCRYLQAPAALLCELPPSLYFCDEPRRVDHDPSATGSRSLRTMPVYRPLYAAQRRVDRSAVSRATRLATNSAFSAREIELAYGRQAQVIASGVPELCLRARPRPPTHLLTVGTMIPSKGHDLAIAGASCARTRRRVLLISPREIVGERRRLMALAHECGVELEIRVGVGDQELVEAYAGAHATLYLAKREPLGLVSLEAQAAGSPVIVAAEGGLPETILDGRTGWAVPRTASAVAAKLDELERPGVRETMSAAARERASAATWSRSADALQGMLEQLAI